MATFERNDTYNKIVDLIAGELSINKNTISEQSTLADLGADSLDIVEIIMKIEEQFGIEVRDEDAEGMKTIKDVVDYVHTHRTK